MTVCEDKVAKEMLLATNLFQVMVGELYTVRGEKYHKQRITIANGIEKLQIDDATEMSLEFGLGALQ